MSTFVAELTVKNPVLAAGRQPSGVPPQHHRLTHSMKQFSISGQLLPFALFLLTSGLNAQIVGGRQAFQFLNLPNSARATALGGLQIAVRDDDAALAFQNPAALNPAMSGALAFNHHFHLADLQNGYFGFAQNLKKLGMTANLGVQYMNYGKVKTADEYGLVTGELSPKEVAVALGAGYRLYEKVTLGANLKFAQSNLGVASSAAVLGDLAALYADSSGWTMAVVFKNIGGQVNVYEEKREAMPFDIQLGVSKRLAHLPFRLSATGHHLYRRDVRYDDPALAPTSSDIFGEQQKESEFKKGVDNFFRHVNFGGEFLFGKREGFRVRFGYSHLRHQEMTVPNLRSLAGFSTGVGVKVSRFRVDFAYSSWHLAGGSVHLGVATNFGEFL